MECPKCGNEYSRRGISQHWNMNKNCASPTLSQKQKEILTGVLMGDGFLNNPDKENSGIGVRVKERRFVEWLSQQFPHTTTQIREVEQQDSNWKTLYSISFMAIDEVSNFSDWYSNGKKKFPDEIDFTPYIVKVWYACDGYLHWSNNSSYPIFGITNERNRVDNLIDSFSDIGIETTAQHYGERLYVKSNSVKDFFNFIGSPIPGYEYKWKYKDKSNYLKSKEK